MLVFLNMYDRLFTYTFTAVYWQSKPCCSFQFTRFVDKYPPNTSSEMEIYRRIEKTILQNIDWINNNEDSLSNWLSGNQPAPSKKPKMMDPLPSSPLAFWHSMPIGFEEN